MLRKRDKMLSKLSILSLFLSSFNNFNETWAPMYDPLFNLSRPALKINSCINTEPITISLSPCSPWVKYWCGSGEAWTYNPSILSQTLYLWAIALPGWNIDVVLLRLEPTTPGSWAKHYISERLRSPGEIVMWFCWGLNLQSLDLEPNTISLSNCAPWVKYWCGSGEAWTYNPWILSQTLYLWAIALTLGEILMWFWWGLTYNPWILSQTLYLWAIALPGWNSDVVLVRLEPTIPGSWAKHYITE